LSYARLLNVPYALVTNGIKIRLYGANFYKSENVTNALIMDIEISSETLGASIESLKYLTRGKLNSNEVYTAFKDFNEQLVVLTLLQEKKDELVKFIVEWVEKLWERGPVKETIVLSALEKVFGRVERIKEIAAQAPPSPTLTPVVASEFEHRPDLGEGIFVYKQDPSKQIDVSRPGSEVERKLKELGLRLSTPTAFWGFTILSEDELD
jgi:hypothetical protein